MLERFWKIFHLLDVDPFWSWSFLVLLILFIIVKCSNPWKSVWKSKKTKDKDGNDVIIHYHIDV